MDLQTNTINNIYAAYLFRDLRATDWPILRVRVENTDHEGVECTVWVSRWAWLALGFAHLWIALSFVNKSKKAARYLRCYRARVKIR